jgi:SAM-dependent methyltransferase
MSTSKSSPSGRDRAAKTQSSYDALAEEYAKRISNELDHRPRERELLERFAARCRNHGMISDLGCGPGHITSYVRGFNPDVIGLDFSLGTLIQARGRHSEIIFIQGDMLALPFASGKLGGVVAFYSIIHFDNRQVDQSLAEMERVLRPGGHLLLGFHVGTGTVHVDEEFGVAIDLEAAFFMSDDLVGRLRRAGFSIMEQFQRDPYPDVEYQSVRGYIWAAKPG